MGAALLAIKTYLPLPLERGVPRPRLLERLQAGVQHRHRLILISAPAGSGKSTLLGEWAAQMEGCLAWLSLDREDNDPTRFWAYFLAAVQTRCPGVGQDLLDDLLGSQPAPVQTVLPQIVNLLAQLPGPLVLALDDYHQIENPSIHENMLYLLEHTPPGFQMVIATRSDPPLPLFRLRARGQLTELRADDLRFTSAEAASFLNEYMGLALDDDLVEQLEVRTEGWAVGLQLAALSLQGREDPAAFINRFSGSHHFILEYLTSEVLAQQPPEIQDFLLETSILESLCADLGRAVSGQPQAEAHLDCLRRGNLFLIPLDDENRWFRYHHLFAELLRVRLAQRGEEAVRELHRRAASWYAGHSLVDEALQHSLAAHDDPFAADLVNRNWRQAVHEGRLKAANRWIEAIPSETLNANPLLTAAYAWVLWLLGKTGQVEPYVDLTERGLAELQARGRMPVDDYEYTSLPGQMAALRAMIAGRRFELEAAARYAEEAIRLSPPDELLALGLARIALSNAHRELGSLRQAIRAYEEAIPTAQASGNGIAAAIAAYNLGRLYLIQGRSDLCEALHRGLLNQAGQDRLPAYGLMWIGLADLAYERNDLGRAEEMLAQGLEQGKRGGYLDLIKNAGVLQARLARARGDTAKGTAVLEETLQLVSQAQTANAIAEVSAWLAWFQVENGQLEAAGRWAETQTADIERSPGFTRGIEAFMLVRVLTRLGRPEEALGLARKLETACAAENSAGRQAEAILLQARSLCRLGSTTAAIERLQAALAISLQQGMVRRFVDEGEEILGLLRNPRLAFPGRPQVGAFAAQVRAAFPAGAKGQGALEPGVKRKAEAQGVASPLSERELEVLRLMAEGLSNPQIAEQLIVSPGTIKTHVSHIYDKLGTQNRAEAVSRGMKLKLI